ncbi:hypothetical protein J3R30DRAFT_3441998 [Lentinula aciculospora]|uniref:Uncharacterized protein n=1 Tax=Lentinula aciculospora TaxID=153920 RepID=A0A9W9APD8_9AGAR|nr:hypothetical protein J3R30DRAFT_3441998 [Lentinula aciculospora]
MVSNVKCRFFDAESGKPIQGGCQRPSCFFIHPTQKEWGSAKSSRPSYRFRMDKMEQQMERDRDRDYRGRDRDWDRDRGRDQTRDRGRGSDKGKYFKTRKRTPEPSSSRLSRNDEVLNRVQSFERPADERWSPHKTSDSRPSSSTRPYGWGYENKAREFRPSGSNKGNGNNNSGWGSNGNSGGGNAWGSGDFHAWDSVDKGSWDAPDGGAWKIHSSTDKRDVKESADPSATSPPAPPTWNDSSTFKYTHRSRNAMLPLLPPSASPHPPSTTSDTFALPSSRDTWGSSGMAAKPFPKAPRAFRQQVTRPSSRKDIDDRTSSPIPVADKRNGNPPIRNASPAITERTSVSMSSSRKTLKSRRVRKVLAQVTFSPFRLLTDVDPSHCRSFDHAVKKEIKHKTVTKAYERWKKIQESPQYGRVRLNGQKKLDNVRSQLKKRRDKLLERVKGEIKVIAGMIKPSPSSPSFPALSNADIDELTVTVRAKLDELNVYIQHLQHSLAEQKKTEEAVKEAAKAREAKEQEAAAAVAASKAQEISLAELKARTAELEVKSYEIVDAQEEDRARFLSPDFIEEALEPEEDDSVYDDLEDIEERLDGVGEQVSKHGMKIGELLGSGYKEKEAALQEKIDKTTQLKKELEAQVAALDQATIKRRGTIDDLSNQIQNLHNRPKLTHSCDQLLPFVEQLVNQIIEQELKPFIIELRATTSAQTRNRQQIITEAIEKQITPIVRMTADIISRSNAITSARGLVNPAAPA